MSRGRWAACALALGLLVLGAGAYFYSRGTADEQVGDPTFVPRVSRPAFPPGQGPVVLLDEAHHNFHRLDGRYRPFGQVLTADGYVVKPSRARFTDAPLAGARLLVIANAIHASNDTNWTQPIAPAFSDPEIEALRLWVERGGSLLLIADHMPFAGAAKSLAAAFGAEYSDGFAMVPDVTGPLVFRVGAGFDMSAIAGPEDHVDSVATFTGSAFQPPEGAAVLLRLPAGAYSIEPKVAWEFDGQPKRPVAGWAQGAAFRYGAGRVALFGEAAMFSSQKSGKNLVGLRASKAAQNEAFLLALIHWLTAQSAASK